MIVAAKRRNQSSGIELRIVYIDFTGENQMNIQYLQELISRISEIKIIGRTAEINGTIYHVMGIVRDGRRMRLLALQIAPRLLP